MNVSSTKEINYKFLLRRIENDIELELSLSKILDGLKKNEIDEEKIIKIIDEDCIKKEELLNIIAIKSFENNMYDYMIPFLQKAYELNPNNADTVYNLAYILNLFGEKDLAIYYLQNIENKNESINELLIEIMKGEINEL